MCHALLVLQEGVRAPQQAYTQVWWWARVSQAEGLVDSSRTRRRWTPATEPGSTHSLPEAGTQAHPVGAPPREGGEGKLCGTWTKRTKAMGGSPDGWRGWEPEASRKEGDEPKVEISVRDRYLGSKRSRRRIETFFLLGLSREGKGFVGTSPERNVPNRQSRQGRRKEISKDRSWTERRPGKDRKDRHLSSNHPSPKKVSEAERVFTPGNVQSEWRADGAPQRR